LKRREDCSPTKNQGVDPKESTSQQRRGGNDPWGRKGTKRPGGTLKLETKNGRPCRVSRAGKPNSGHKEGIPRIPRNMKTGQIANWLTKPAYGWKANYRSSKDETDGCDGLPPQRKSPRQRGKSGEMSLNKKKNRE